MVKIALGEPNKIDGFITIDNYGNPDILFDLENGIPMPDNSCEYIQANQLVEHIRNIEKLFREMYRVCKNGAIIHIETPHRESEESWIDITHVNHWSKQTPEWLCGDNYLARKNGWKFELVNKSIAGWNMIFEMRVVKPQR
jgi:ubiquinone/menaquinone biosynthesis C-methylase UbiE